MMFVHGGPTGQDVDAWDPEVLAYVDLGFVVGMVNYRGSTGYGREWRDRLIGDIGGPELVDVNAGMADLVAWGIADRDRAVVGAGRGAATSPLLEVCKHPDLWLAGIAWRGAVATTTSATRTLSPDLQAYDRALLGGTSDEVPDPMRERNPINFADRVRAPLIFLIGENTRVVPSARRWRSSTSSESVQPSARGRRSARGTRVDIDEEVRQMRAILPLARHVPGVTVL